MSGMGWKAVIAITHNQCDRREMESSIYAFKAEGVAGSATDRREGARHTIMIFAKGQSAESAKALAYRIAADNGWTLVTLQKGGMVTVAPDDIDEPYLRAALLDAIQGGSAMVTYEAELPPNA